MEKTTVSFPNLNLTFDIPVSFRLPVLDFEIYMYALIITFGIIMAYIFITLEGKRQKIDTEIFSDIILIGLPCAIVGARLYYVIYKWEYYSDNLTEIFNLRGGGLAVYGGVIAGVIAAYIYLKKKKQPILKIFDICSIGLLIGQCIGRWGNFFNQEAFGYNTTLPWGMTSDVVVEYLSQIQKKGVLVSPNLPVHPTFLYESMWSLCGIIILAILIRRKKYDGQIFFSYVFWYGLGRFFIEGLRTDSLYIGSFRVSQLVALISVIIGVAVNIILYKRNKKT